MKKAIVVLSIVALALTAIGCASAPAGAAPAATPVAAAPTVKMEVIEHKASGIGGNIPEWVQIYIESGNSGVEALEKFQKMYVFVGEDSGVNLNALRLWAQGFNVAQDLARLVSTRVQAKFAGAAAGSPDDEFGRYFENVVKSASEATITGARKDSDFWVYKRYFKADGKTEDRVVYDYYVLVTIDREVLKTQLDKILAGVVPDKPVTKQQQTAIDRVKESFYEGF